MGVMDGPTTLSPFFVQFPAVFGEKMAKIGWRNTTTPPPKGLATPFWEIVDLPLQWNISNILSFFDCLQLMVTDLMVI